MALAIARTLGKADRDLHELRACRVQESIPGTRGKAARGRSEQLGSERRPP